MRWTERIRRVIGSRRAGALTAVAWAGIILGCMSISIGGKHVTTGHHEDGTFVQEGKVRLGPGCEQVVYYPMPYACPPNLEVDTCKHQCAIVDQKEGCFRIINNGPFSRTVDWTARGMKGPPPRLGIPVPPPAVPTLPAPRPLTAEPVGVVSEKSQPTAPAAGGGAGETRSTSETPN